MSAPELLLRLRQAGLALTVTPMGGLHVAPRQALTDELREDIRAGRDALVSALEAEESKSRKPNRCGNPLMTAEQGDACHLGGWGDLEITTFMAREALFLRRGWTKDAENLAERLTLRDRQADQRRLCLECCELQRSGQCAASQRGDIAGPDQRNGILQATLILCPAFRASELQGINPSGEEHGEH